MDDLIGEDWQKPAKPTTTAAPANNNPFSSNYSNFRASPQPQQSSNATLQNLSRPQSTVNGAKGATKDTFGNLLSLKSQQGGSNVSMQERQKQLSEEKRKQQEQESQMWDTLGSGRGTPEIRQPSPATAPKQEEVNDILAAFHKDAPVNKASHFAPPQSGANSGRSTPAVNKQAQPRAASNGAFMEEEEDDPFGLGSIQNNSDGRSAVPTPVQTDDDDILGDLGRPVTERPAPAKSRSPTAHGLSNISPQPVDVDASDAPDDRALAELVDMGFLPDNAKIALSEAGGDVQNAVGWLLHQAHEESRQKSRSETPSQHRPQNNRSPQRQARGDQEAMPAWMKTGGRASSAAGRQNDGGAAGMGEKDASQIAQEYGTKFFKSANSLWKASQKQMAKTMSDFQQQDGGDPNQPKWMRDTSAGPGRANGQPQQADRPAGRSKPKDVTDEAAMLDSPMERPQKPSRPPAPTQRSSQSPARGRSPVEPLPHRPSSQPKSMQQSQPIQDRRPATKLSRQEVESQSAEAYISPARRKRPTPQPKAAPTSPPQQEVDLFSSAPPATAPKAPQPTSSRPTSARPSPAPRPQAPPRNLPSVSSTALSTSASHRKAGGEHYKRGDYAAAHESYTSALTLLPSTHPVAIIVLTNRSLTGLKTGDAKVAVSDADRALEIIGPGQGAGETIDLGGGEGSKDMRDFYGKAIMRKAEALEHMEKYTDAAGVWRHAVEGGVGGAVSIRGRDRCEKAAAPKPAAPKKMPVHSSAPRPGKPPPSKSLGNSLQRPAIASVTSDTAVKNLRAANAAAEKADEEKFALSDSVDARLSAWKNGKTDNLRALLQSLDTVLWDGAGWKKVGMSDLVMANRVKIVYMKAIAKVHPDKIPLDATVEQKMVSAAVFSTLNEAWDKFKKENNL